MKNLTKLQTTDFETVFAEWKKREGNDPGWIHCATVVKGWPNWESWRRYSFELLKPNEKVWTVYEITNPNEFIPAMRIGPYSGWQENFEKKNSYNFQQAGEIEAFYHKFAQNTKVLELIKNFPNKTQFIGAILPDNQVVCLEGHHRAAAIALAKKQGKPIQFTQNPTIALMALNQGEENILDEMLARGTVKPL